MSISFPTQPITSSHNPNFSRWLKLLDSRGIQKHQQFFLFGEKVVKETLAAFSDLCLELVIHSSHGVTFPIPSHVKKYVLSKSLFRNVDMFGTNFPLLICRTPLIPPMDFNQPPDGLELLCPLGDPANVGAMIRSAKAFGVNKVVLLEEAAFPFHPKAVRAGSGSLLIQSLYRGPSINQLQALKHGRLIIALNITGKPLPGFVWPANLRLLIGQEGKGLTPSQFRTVLSIPMAQHANSLNAVTAASIACYAYRLAYPLSP